MVISVLASTALYALAQLVATGVHPALGTSETPLVDAVGSFAGQRGRKLMELAALISSFGFCASSALVGPRYLEAFAEDGFMPAAFMHRAKRWGTPALAVGALSALVAGLLVSGLKFQRLADVSNVAVVVQYVATCVAVLVLRRKAPSGKQSFVIPFGPLVPCLALGGCLAFLQFVGPFELKLAAIMITIGLVIGAINRSAQAARAKRRAAAAASDEHT
jgi:amino acid transporter